MDNKRVDKFDVNDPNFYNNLQDEIETDLARLKKSVEVVRNLRMVAAEMEVETASLYHGELWRDVEELKALNESETSLKPGPPENV
ncbi:uncharacterized protein LOC114356692 [Ostrinia furnacalis]|uniref:uncharacterized protein LOC114356692 n=1 Tax=Ostrinia furnacalis TaxID=93504 RepID=UPI00103DB43B|nr:uncharacterized protein LOC114356692 [Ostrinia furnacalis]